MSFGKNSTGALEIVDANDYYPFGMNHLKTGNAFFGQESFKKYKYNGKELQETGMYDYGARMYMPDVPHWGTIDPLAEKMRSWSPYNYAFDNPMRFIDPDGRAPLDDYRLNRNGTFTLLKKTNDNFDRVYNNNKSKSIEISKGIIQSGRTFKNTTTYSFAGIPYSKESYNSSYYFAKDGKAVDDLSRLYNFASYNTNKEFILQKYDNGNNTFAALGTDYKSGNVSGGLKISEFYMADPKMKMTYQSHSHPGKYNSQTYWPAYPSGFNSNLTPDLTLDYQHSGDRGNYQYYNAMYPGRIPSTFNINIGDNSGISVDYNGTSATRTSLIEEVIISIKKK